MSCAAVELCRRLPLSIGLPWPLPRRLPPPPLVVLAVVLALVLLLMERG